MSNKSRQDVALGRVFDEGRKRGYVLRAWLCGGTNGTDYRVVFDDATALVTASGTVTWAGRETEGRVAA